MADDWLARFHDGDRTIMEECYRDHFAQVDRRVGRILRGADRETVVHEVFFRLLSSRELRLGFTGGSLGAWLSQVAHHQAIDFARRHGREEPMSEDPAEEATVEQAAEAHILVERFCRELPPEWVPVFEKRFVERLSQRDAARALGLRRTTLVYRELRIRRLLRRFFLRGRR